MNKKYAPGTHWTQKPENKIKLLKLAKARHKRKYIKRADKVVAISNERNSELENNVNEKIQYTLGYIEATLENTAKLSGIPEQYLTRRVAELLLQSRKRSTYRVSNLRENLSKAS